jgi:hypothetical protein
MRESSHRLALSSGRAAVRKINFVALASGERAALGKRRHFVHGFPRPLAEPIGAEDCDEVSITPEPG